MSEQERTSPPTPPGSRRARRAPISRAKRRVFALLAALIPLLVIGALEGGLRLAGYGGHPPTFVAVGKLDTGATLYRTDPAGPASYFFADRSGAEGMALDPVTFAMPKPANTLRVLWVGASAAKGIPEPRPLRASAFFQAMLADCMADTRVEVLNLGVPGIAAYPVLGVMTDALRFDPDVAVVYVGNNEYYGAYGVASLHSGGRSPFMIRLNWFVRTTAIGQAMSRLLHGAPPRASGAMIETMVGQSSIGPDDPARVAAPRNLEVFVGDMIDRCRARGIPVIVCAPPANESGMAPLGTPDLSALASAQREEIGRILAVAPGRIEADPAGVEASLRRVLELAPDDATATYWLGHALAAQGRMSEADGAFRRAMDLDPMPWRPPSSSVEAIKRAAATRGAIVADLEAAFRKTSPIGAPGWDLFDDHVHPSLRGQELAARTVLEAMTRLPAPLAPDPEAIGVLPDADAYAQRLGATIYEVYAVAHKMRMLGSVSMFRETNPWMLERNTRACAEIEASQPAPVVSQLRRWADPANHLVDRQPITALVGDAMLQLGKPGEAAHLYRVASACATPYSARRLGFVFLALAARLQSGVALDEADRQWARDSIGEGVFLVRTDQPDAGQAALYVGQLTQILGDFAGSIPHLLSARGRVTGAEAALADRALVIAYIQTGQAEKARAIVQAGLAGSNPDAYREMRALLR